MSDTGPVRRGGSIAVRYASWLPRCPPCVPVSAAAARRPSLSLSASLSFPLRPRGYESVVDH